MPAANNVVSLDTPSAGRTAFVTLMRSRGNPIDNEEFLHSLTTLDPILVDGTPAQLLDLIDEMAGYRDKGMPEQRYCAFLATFIRVGFKVDGVLEEMTFMIRICSRNYSDEQRAALKEHIARRLPPPSDQKQQAQSAVLAPCLILVDV